MNMKKVGIIGSGIGGLAIAIRLVLKGYSVEVFEANDSPGGKLNEFSEKGYRFDGGPSLFTMPSLVDELFVLADKNPKDYFEYIKLDEVCRYFWEDGTKLTVPADKEIFDKIVSEILDEKPGKILKYLSDSDFKYKTLSNLFIYNSLHKFSTWISKEAIKGYLNIFKMGVFGKFHQHNISKFSNPKTVQFFDRYATYNGSNPYQTPATMSIIPHLEYNVGAFLPKAGIYDIVKGLYKLAIELGIKFHFNQKVEEIILENDKAKYLKIINKQSDPYDFIVSNMDVTPTYRKLLPKVKSPEKTLNQEKSGSGLIFYWGIKKQFPQLGLHNIFFSDNYEEEFIFQFGKKAIYSDPTIYLNITSKIINSDAPANGENWFVLINAPANAGQDWKTIIELTKKATIAKLSRILGEDIEKLIEFERILDPILIEKNTSSSQGALYGNSSNNKFSAFLRHPNFSKKISNLFFVGGSVHPGGGIPLALSSAKIASDFFGTVIDEPIYRT
jgi:phytoene desaturase